MLNRGRKVYILHDDLYPIVIINIINCFISSCNKNEKHHFNPAKIKGRE